MSLRMATTAVADLPPLRILMGGAMGMALAQAASAQVTAPVTQPQPSGVAPVQLPPISVQGSDTQGGYQTVVPALSNLTQPLLDTPESISVIPRQLMDDQGVTAVRDALRNVPGISLAAGEAGAQGDNLTLRGFSARNDFYLDGMRDFGSYYRDPFNLQEIEVLKGPASVLFGRGSTGGVINQVSKQPQLAPITSATTVLGTDGTYRVTGDINRTIEGLDGAAFRLDVMGNLNGIAERGSTDYRRLGFAPSLAFGIGTDTRLNISFYHLQEYDTPDYGLPWLFASPAPVSRDTYYGFANSDYFRTNVNIGTVKLEHDVNEHVTLRDQFRYASYGRSGRITEPQVIYPGSTPASRLGRRSAQSTSTGMRSRSPVRRRISVTRRMRRSGLAPASWRNRGRRRGVRARNLQSGAHRLFRRAARQPAVSRLQPAVHGAIEHQHLDQHNLQQLLRIPDRHAGTSGPA
jgi:catecholate siderophore receptor